jgi:hypothetical protein
MADSDFFKQFRKNYKPKVLDLSPYLRRPRLNGYKILNEKKDLVPYKTYVKYINISDAFQDENLDSHIHTGGILLKGGKRADKFYEVENPAEWTHLLLKYDPSPIIDEDDNVIRDRLAKPRTFTIKISNYHVFYRTFGNNSDMRNFIENMEIELV